MHAITIPETGFVGAWRKAARDLIERDVPPDAIEWSFGTAEPSLFTPAAEPLQTRRKRRNIAVPRGFITLVEAALCHSDRERFALCYRVLCRLQAERWLLRDQSDPDIARLDRMHKAVRRDAHKMTAFVRFRDIGVSASGRRCFVAWFEPDHFIVERTAPFFAGRFGDMDWTIATPRLTAHHIDGQVSFSPGRQKPDLGPDDTDELWRTYFANIFNPARLKVKAMQAEMPKKYWRNLPEADLIPELIASAEARSREMQAKAPTLPPTRAKRILERLAEPDEAGTIGAEAKTTTHNPPNRALPASTCTGISAQITARRGQMSETAPRYTGLTWDHPRGSNALARAANQVNANGERPLIQWDKQPLEGFESAPISDLAARYDLVVLDHPHVGEAVAENCLIPVGEVFSADQIKAWEAASVGPSLASYRFGGELWALPLDVATQVVARRPDVFGSRPTEWEEIAEMAARRPVALSVGGPHAVLTLFSIAGGEGHVPAGDAMLPDEPALTALDWMHRVHDRRPKGSETLNPIALSEAMATGDEIALVPLIFGYVNYARAEPPRRTVAFSDTPRMENGYGGVLGGTGIAFSKRATQDSQLRDHIAWLMDEETQARFIPGHDGQPSARTAWQDETVNADWGGFYRDTLETAEHALLRPRFDGYIAFQTAASDAIRAALAAREDPTVTLGKLRNLWTDAREGARGSLDDDRLS